MVSYHHDEKGGVDEGEEREKREEREEWLEKGEEGVREVVSYPCDNKKRKKEPEVELED